MKTYTKKEKIKYLDVDKNNQLKSKAIIDLMQNTAGEHTDLNGDGLKDKEKTHMAWLALNWKVKVFTRPSYGKTLEVKTWIKKTEHCCSWREFEVYCGKKLVAIADSRWVLTNTESCKIIKVPEIFIEKYSPKGKGVFEEALQEKIKEPQNLKLAYEETIGRAKIDTNNHLNNLYYLDFAIESLPEEIYENTNFSNIQIMYKKQVKYKDTVKCFYAQENNKHIVVIKSENEKILHAIVEMYNE